MSGSARLEVGRIGKAHGLRGEVVLGLTSNREDRVAKGSVLYVDGRELVIASARPHQGKHLVRFDGVTDRNAADELRGALVEGLPIDDPGEMWVHELVDSAVVDTTGSRLGVVVAVDANPASDLLVLDNDALIPLTFLVSRTADEIVVDPPDGLLALHTDDG